MSKKTSKTVARKSSTKAAASKSLVKKSKPTSVPQVAHRSNYKPGDKVQLLSLTTLKPIGSVLKVQKPEKGELSPGKGWFIVKDLWTHHTGLVPA
jgi:hypothetical protein